MTASEAAELRDYQCMITGVGLIGAECGAVLLREGSSGFQPVSLPLWGHYLGRGFLEEVSEGPNAEILLEALQRLHACGRLVVDWNALGIEPRELDHVETVLGLLALARIHGPTAIRCDGAALGFCILSAHVAASLMNEEPSSVPSSVSVERLPTVVFDNAPLGQELYAGYSSLPVRLRCHFALALVGLAALSDGLASRAIPWSPPTPPTAVDAAATEQWFSQALASAQDDPVLLAGLAEHASGRSEDDPQSIDTPSVVF